jgi:hypothetical protein
MGELGKRPTAISGFVQRIIGLRRPRGIRDQPLQGFARLRHGCPFAQTTQVLSVHPAATGRHPSPLSKRRDRSTGFGHGTPRGTDLAPKGAWMMRVTPHDPPAAAQPGTRTSPRHGQTPSPSATARPRFLDQVRRACRLRHFSRRTEDAYAGWIRRFIAWSGMPHPVTLNETDAAAFLSSLAVDHHVSASTQN